MPGVADSNYGSRIRHLYSIRFWPAEKPAVGAKGNEKLAAKTTTKTGGKSSESKAAKAEATKPEVAKEAAADGKVGLLVRLYFSPHEKLSEQRWVARIPAEEPFKSASPKVIHQNDPSR